MVVVVVDEQPLKSEWYADEFPEIHFVTTALPLGDHRPVMHVQGHKRTNFLLKSVEPPDALSLRINYIQFNGEFPLKLIYSLDKRGASK